MSTGNWIAICSVIVVGLGAIAGGMYSYRQLKQLAQSSETAARAAQMEALVHVTDLVNFETPTISAARRWVFGNAPRLLSTSLEALDPDERARIDEVWRTWDRIGLLVHHGLVDPEPVMEMWAHSIERTFRILWGRLHERRTGGNNPHAMTHFQLLCRRARAYNELHDNIPHVGTDRVVSEMDSGSPFEVPGWIDVDDRVVDTKWVIDISSRSAWETRVSAESLDVVDALHEMVRYELEDDAIDLSYKEERIGTIRHGRIDNFVAYHPKEGGHVLVEFRTPLTDAVEASLTGAKLEPVREFPDDRTRVLLHSSDLGTHEEIVRQLIRSSACPPPDVSAEVDGEGTACHPVS